MAKKIVLLVLLLSVPSILHAYSLLDYFTDKAKPVIASDFRADKYHHGKVTIPFIIKEDETSVKEVHVYLDDKDVTSKVEFGPDYYKNKYTVDSEELPDGAHTLTIIVEDSSNNNNRTVQEIPLYIDNAAPLLELASGGGTFAQGKTAYLYFTSSEPSIEVSGIFQGKELRAYPYRNKYRAVIGFSIDDPGNKKYFMRVKATDRAGNISDYHYNIYVKRTKFGTLSFILKPKKVEMLMPDTIRADWKKIEDVVIQENPEKYYQGKFMRPLGGRVSMTFGLDEFINGYESGKHRGLDFAAAAGTPIKASNSGIVRLSEYLPAHGNAVVIDHGQGIFTYYAHMSKIIAMSGEKVKKGQVIGLVGATGVATGPHLHFSMSLHNLRVDPKQWLDGVIVD